MQLVSGAEMRRNRTPFDADAHIAHWCASPLLTEYLAQETDTPTVAEFRDYLRWKRHNVCGLPEYEYTSETFPQYCGKWGTDWVTEEWKRRN